MSLRKRFPTAFYLGIILFVIAMNWIVFRSFHANYFLWYLKNGAIISLVTGFLAPTFTKLDARLGLVSAHPAMYVGTCEQLLGVFIFSLSPASNKLKSQTRPVPEIGDNRLTTLFDEILYIPIVIVLGLLALAWLVLMAPLGYFVTLIAGVPARQNLRGSLLPTLVSEDKERVTIVESQSVLPPEAKVGNISFAQDPFAITQALTSLILFIANLIHSQLN